MRKARAELERQHAVCLEADQRALQSTAEVADAQ
jgi:hypothetical protein